jgi:erythromycin esterase
MHATLNHWIRSEAILFSADSTESFNSAVDKVIASLGNSVELLGFGEALHGGEDILKLRNRLFERLVAMHGYSAIAMESSFPRARLVNDYVSGRGSSLLDPEAQSPGELAEVGPGSYEDVKDHGFSHGFGRLDANRELVEWIRRYNADPSHPVKIRHG